MSTAALQAPQSGGGEQQPPQLPTSNDGAGLAPDPSIGIQKPHLHDVLCGRGGGTNNHVGNNHWRTLVGANKRLYISLPKRQKMLVAQSIVRAVRSQNPPGRFLQKDRNTGLWHDIGDQKAQDKTSQALREGAPDIRSKMKTEHQQQQQQQQFQQNDVMAPVVVSGQGVSASPPAGAVGGQPPDPAASSAVAHDGTAVGAPEVAAAGMDPEQQQERMRMIMMQQEQQQLSQQQQQQQAAVMMMQQQHAAAQAQQQQQMQMQAQQMQAGMQQALTPSQQLHYAALMQQQQQQQQQQQEEAYRQQLMLHAQQVQQQQMQQHHRQHHDIPQAAPSSSSTRRGSSGGAAVAPVPLKVTVPTTSPEPGSFGDAPLSPLDPPLPTDTIGTFAVPSMGGIGRANGQGHGHGLTPPAPSPDFMPSQFSPVPVPELRKFQQSLDRQQVELQQTLWREAQREKMEGAQQQQQQQQQKLQSDPFHESDSTIGTIGGAGEPPSAAAGNDVGGPLSEDPRSGSAASKKRLSVEDLARWDRVKAMLERSSGQAASSGGGAGAGAGQQQPARPPAAQQEGRAHPGQEQQQQQRPQNEAAPAAPSPAAAAAGEGEGGQDGGGGHGGTATSPPAPAPTDLNRDQSMMSALSGMSGLLDGCEASEDLMDLARGETFGTHGAMDMPDFARGISVAMSEMSLSRGPSLSGPADMAGGGGGGGMGGIGGGGGGGFSHSPGSLSRGGDDDDEKYDLRGQMTMPPPSFRPPLSDATAGGGAGGDEQDVNDLADTGGKLAAPAPGKGRDDISERERIELMYLQRGTSLVYEAFNKGVGSSGGGGGGGS